ncbi:MAG: GIY-YIG nuclease family protein [Candidatus Brocadiales bacterium]|nr:GIY-YIG nuclease family protein [Candidatus Brocadiales bacterium]
MGFFSRRKKEIDPVVMYAKNETRPGALGKGRFKKEKMENVLNRVTNSPGIYRFREIDSGEIVYIGITAKNLRERIRRHYTDFLNGKKHFDLSKCYVEYSSIHESIPTHEIDYRLRETEISQIAKHQPRYNRNKGGGGKIPLRKPVLEHQSPKTLYTRIVKLMPFSD